MLCNIVTIRIYGKDKRAILDQLLPFDSEIAITPSLVMSYGDDDFDLKGKNLVEFLTEQQKHYSNLWYKIFFGAQKTSPRYGVTPSDAHAFLPLFATQYFDPCDIASPSSSYFTTDPQSQVGILKKRGYPGLKSCDYDGIWYFHHSLVSLLKERQFTGLTFYPITSNDQYIHSFYFITLPISGSLEEHLGYLNEKVCGELNAENSTLCVAAERAVETKEKIRTYFQDLIDNEEPCPCGSPHLEGREALAETYFEEFSPPPPGSSLTKWMAVDVEQVTGVEGDNEYTTEHRVCPITGKVYPLLVGQLKLKQDRLPKDLDFFRTENNHLIVSKRVYDVLNEAKITAPVSYEGILFT